MGNSYRHTIAGTEYRIRFSNLKTHRGDCTSPTVARPEIRIKRGLAPLDTLSVLIHEFLHAAGFDLLSEQWVDDTSTELAALLKKMGYLKCKNDRSTKTK